MARYSFGIAEPTDDAQLRARLAEDHMGDGIRISFRREPNYFDACKVQGDTPQIIKCTDSNSGRIVGLGARFTLLVYVNGVISKQGYLADLRGESAVRNGTLLARGYKYLRELHEAAPVDYYYSLILSNNHKALGQLASKRAGLPHYEHHGKMLTPAIHLDLPKTVVKMRGLRFTTADKSNVTEVFAFIQREYSKKQFAPFYQPADLNSLRLKKLSLKDIIVAYRGNRIVGTIAAWDQRSFRQTHVEGYPAAMRLGLPVYDALSKITPLKPLPSVGDPVPHLYLALMAVEHDDSGVFRALLRHVYHERRSGSWHYMIAGVHERSPLACCLSEYRHIPASGEFYTVRYPGTGPVEILDDRIPHIEIACL